MEKSVWHTLENLVLVAGHAVYVGRDGGDDDDPSGDDVWVLQDFQRGEPRFYIEHIRRGVELAASDARALLVFSGGQTRREAGQKSEAEGYRALAERFRWWGAGGVRARATNEEFARDSFENLLFGICRFYECARRFPQKITVVSWAFKEKRFMLHREALRFPAARFTFVGANNPSDLDAALRGEMRNAIEPFTRDPYGTGEQLSAKRRERNPFGRHHRYETTCPSLKGLLRHQETLVYAGPLPW
jgi:hypothetical protein